MHKYKLLSLKCNMCNWRWEITPEEKKENICCIQCGSKNIDIDEKKLQVFKQNGKIITDLGFISQDKQLDETPIEDLTENFEEPLIVLKQNDIKISDEMTNDERVTVLGKINSIRSKIINDLKESNEDCFQRLK